MRLDQAVPSGNLVNLFLEKSKLILSYCYILSSVSILLPLGSGIFTSTKKSRERRYFAAIASTWSHLLTATQPIPPWQLLSSFLPTKIMSASALSRASYWSVRLYGIRIDCSLRAVKVIDHYLSRVFVYKNQSRKFSRIQRTSNFLEFFLIPESLDVTSWWKKKKKKNLDSWINLLLEVACCLYFLTNFFSHDAFLLPLVHAT